MKKFILITAVLIIAGIVPSVAQHSDTLHPIADVFVYTWGGGQGGNAYLKFDISSLPANIVVSNAKLEVNVFARVLPWDDDVKFINLNNQTWVEGDNGDMLWNSLKSDTIIQLLNFATGIGWASSTNIAPILLRDYNQSHSFCTILMKDPDDGTMGPQSGVPATDLNDSIIVGNIIGGFNGYIMFRPREYSDQSKIPMFIIDYGVAPEISILPIGTTTCDGDSITFNVIATGDPTLLYQWQKNGSSISGATLSSYTLNPVTPADAGNYRCIVTNAFGADTSNVAILNVNPLPTKYNVTSGGSYCAGGAGLPVGLSGSDIGVSYMLYCNGVYAGQTMAGSGTALSFGNQTTTCCYTVIATNAFLCSDIMNGNACVTIDSLQVNVIANPDSICPGSSSTLTATGGGTYQWCCGLGTNPAVIVNPASTTTYTVTVSGTNGCTASGSVTVYIDNFNIVTVTATPDTICPGDCSVLTATANGGCSPYSYQWSPSGNLNNSTIANPLACPTSTTTYTVSVLDCLGCTAIGNATVDVEVCPGISEYNNGVNIRILPNPFSTSAQIISDKDFNDAELKVYDLLGNQVKDMRNISGKTINIYRQGLFDGMYFYEISEKNISIVSGKFILN